MQRLPKRPTLSRDTAEVLREAVAAGQWPRWLPAEHDLTRQLKVSRTTLRSALALLEREGVLIGGQGRRREIARMAVPGSTPPPTRNVVLLSPSPPDQFTATSPFWIDALRVDLAADGWTLETAASAGAFRRRPEPALEEIAARCKPAGWVLHRSTPEIQRWFTRTGRPCVAAGSLHPGISLPAVDVDFHAASRHAAGVFLAARHRRLAILRPETRLAGDAESEKGFREGAACRDEAHVQTVFHQGTPESLVRSLERLFTGKDRPTGLFVFHAFHFVTALTWLQTNGHRVPHDVALISRDDAPFLSHLLPAPSRYEIATAAFARKLSRLVTGILSGGAPGNRQVLVMPGFIRGGTIGK